MERIFVANFVVNLIGRIRTGWAADEVCDEVLGGAEVGVNSRIAEGQALQRGFMGSHPFFFDLPTGHEPGTSGRAGAPPPAAETVSPNVSTDPLGPWERYPPGWRAAESAPYLSVHRELRLHRRPSAAQDQSAERAGPSPAVSQPPPNDLKSRIRFSPRRRSLCAAASCTASSARWASSTSRNPVSPAR